MTLYWKWELNLDVQMASCKVLSSDITVSLTVDGKRSRVDAEAAENIHENVAPILEQLSLQNTNKKN
jgi:hypothetical protein